MKYALVLALALGCARIQAAAEQVAYCAGQAMPASLPDAVAAALARTDYETQLGSLATVYGLAIVDCVVNAWLSQQSSPAAQASVDSIEMVDRARAWLAKHPAT